ncbi:MAG: HEPN domain-containing protein, partial [Lachnospiraceae bacterium]|nr:HEPN domain-containing protein [Lachnospiraceae bacterium]
MVRENHLVYQAKSFYNAYIALEQIGRQAEDDLLLYIPTIVNGAFSCELTLKAILAKNKIKYDNEHNLLSLFELLPDSFRNELLGHLIQKAPEY